MQRSIEVRITAFHMPDSGLAVYRNFSPVSIQFLCLTGYGFFHIADFRNTLSIRIQRNFSRFIVNSFRNTAGHQTSIRISLRIRNQYCRDSFQSFTRLISGPKTGVNAKTFRFFFPRIYGIAISGCFRSLLRHIWNSQIKRCAPFLILRYIKTFRISYAACINRNLPRIFQFPDPIQASIRVIRMILIIIQQGCQQFSCCYFLSVLPDTRNLKRHNRRSKAYLLSTLISSVINRMFQCCITGTGT